MVFTDAFTVNEGVSSTWQQRRKLFNNAVQTEPQQVVAEEVQTDISSFQGLNKTDVGEGTDAFPPSVPEARRTQGHAGWSYDGTHYSPPDVDSFLAGVQDELMEVLDENTRSTAFDGYEAQWTERKESVSKLVTFAPPPVIAQDEAELHAVDVAWNSNSSCLAVAYGRLDTVAWCHGKGYVVVWSVQRSETASATKPVCVYEATSYVTSLAFHPTKPSLLAGGTYTGDVMLWNVADPSQPAMNSASSTVSHREPVCRVHWLQNLREVMENYRYVLCSSSGDGKVLFWSPTNKLQEHLAAYEVQNKKRNLVGVESMAFAFSGGTIGKNCTPGVENVMLLGMESGDVYRTKPGGSISDSAKGTNISVLDIEMLQPHSGPVNSIECSPFHRNLFLTCSSDGSLRLYSNLEREALMAIEPSTNINHYLYDAQFSPTRPAVVAAVSRSSHLHIFDLTQSTTKPVVSVESGVDGCPAICLSFTNSATDQLVAVGDQRGTVHVWQLSYHLTRVTEAERTAIRSSDPRSSKAGQVSSEKAWGALIGVPLA